MAEEILRFDSVSCIADNSETIVDLSFSMVKGETLVIFGPERSGISLICPLIAGMIDDFEGEILYRGRPIKSFDYIEKNHYRKELGYVQEHFGLINNMSVEDNIALPLKYHSDLSLGEIGRLVDTYIRELNLEHCRHMRPIDLKKSEMLNTAYARAIIQTPSILLMELSTEGQCLINIQTYLENLWEKSRGDDFTLVITTYGPQRYFDIADRFLMLYNGNVVFSGKKEDFSGHNNPYLDQYLRVSRKGPMRIL